MAAMSPRSPSSVIQVANDIATLKVLESSKLGKVKYETGWDKSPHSFLKLVSEVQQYSDLHKSLILERAYQITEKEKKKKLNSKEVICDNSPEDSSCSGSTINEFYNNDYYESVSTTPSHTPVSDSPKSKNERCVTFAEEVSRSNTLSEENKGFKDALMNLKANSTSQSLSAELTMLSVHHGHILKHGLGCRDEEYNDEEILPGFTQDCLVFERVRDALQFYEDEKGGEYQARVNHRRNSLLDGRTQVAEDVQEKVAELKRNSEIRQLRQQQKIQKSVETGKKQLEAFTSQQRLERERIKQAQEAEKKLYNDKRREEEVAAAVLAAAKIEQDKLEVKRKLKEADDERERHQAAEIAKVEEQKRKAVVEAAAAAVKIDTPKKSLDVPPEFYGFILAPDLQRYLKSQQFLSDYKDKFAHITAKTTKEYYASALKVVNTTLNSISNSPAHIQTKVDLLVNLLQGKRVFLGESSGTSFASTDLPQGDLFVSNLLAYRFVKKSESEISKGHTSVEPLALLGVSVARQFPQWAVLVRGHFYKLCPYLVPFSFPRQNMSIEDYAVTMGHDLKGSESAVRQALLDKMTGYCTLYALMVKIFSQQKVSDVGEATQFFSMTEVWRILATTMKLRPQLDMTATVIQILLDNLGSRLSVLYGVQFKKLIELLLVHYLQEIRKETPQGKAAAVTRLELFLESKSQKGF